MSANLVLRFVLELCALAALAIWGAHVDADGRVALLLALLAPLSAATAWGLFVSPKARFECPTAWRLAVELAVFLAATGGLFAMGQFGLALAFAAAVTVHEVLRGVEWLRRAR